MEINNFKLIETYMDFKNKGDFYFLQIVKRKAENPDMPKTQRTIKNFFIQSKEYYWKHEEEIKELCINNKARAYFRLNVRNLEKIALQTLSKIASNIASKNYDIYNSFEQACGLHHSDTDKKWIIDIDGDILLVNLIKPEIEKLLKESNGVIKGLVKTPNGYHIISNPFNLQKFKQTNPHIDVHKDNPTILYYNYEKSQASNSDA